jgi:aspartyl-tRNA synthetase
VKEDVLFHLGGEWSRTHYCGELSGSDIGAEVVLAGWVKRVRELGYLTFLDLWDRTGIVQLVVEKDQDELHRLFRSLKAEDVIVSRGSVRGRPDEMINRDMKTGEIEVIALETRVLNRSKVPPFTVTNNVQANEDLRLRYRYLDLRRDPLQRNLEMRHKLALTVREYLSEERFMEIETPMLVRRTPEGARDYLVPSRLQPGKFYALPQSPQLYKQILMVAGFDRYFQLARCLRDEDLRADRQPEHTQIDIEMSFVSEEEVYGVVEELMVVVFREVAGIDLETPFPRMSYDEAMNRYGTDKPDVRFGLEIEDCSNIFASSGFKVFRSIVERGGSVRGLAFEEGAALSRKEIGELETIVQEAGAGGLASLKIEGDRITSPIAKFLADKEITSLKSTFDVTKPSLILLVGGAHDIVLRALGELRNSIGRSLLDDAEKTYNFMWVNRFPLFLPAEDGGWEPAHHIFSMPLEEDIGALDSDPGAVHGHLYDLVCNGSELGSGSIRIHRRDLQEKVLGIIGIGSEEAERKFGFLLEAFEHGAPPHGGVALGLDRIATLIGGGTSIRDYIAFPKTQRAASLMEGAPSVVEEALLRELHVRIVEGKKEER